MTTATPEPAGPDLHLAQADLGPFHFAAVGTTAEQATTALRAALARLGDDLDLDPAVIEAVTPCALTGPPGTVWRDGDRYP